MNQITFDRLTYLDALKASGIPVDQARAHANALDGALRDSVATKYDMALMKHDLEFMKHDLELIKRDITIRMGGMIMALGGVLIAIRYLG